MDNILTRVNTYILNPLIEFMFVVAFAYFLWGVLQYFLYQDSEDSRKIGKNHILWGLVGLLIMTGFWGIIQIIAGTLGQSVPHP